MGMHAVNTISACDDPRGLPSLPRRPRRTKSCAPRRARLTSGPEIDHTLLVSLAEDSLSLSDRLDNRTPVAEQGHGPLTALAREALGNEPEKVRRFLDAIAPTVRRTCRSVMGYAHPDLEDAIQESLIDLVRALPQYRFEADVSHYAAKIALRVAIAERSKNRARVEHLRLFHQSRESRPSSPDPAGIVADVECSRLAQLIVRKLKRSQTEAVLLRFFLGCSVEEIASITGVSVDTAKTRLRTGKDKLRRYLEKQGYSPETAGVFR
jgi:RNA polymerase sigma factor (sigma-70 family)